MENTRSIKSISIHESINQFIFHCEYEKKLDLKTVKAYQTDLSQFKRFINIQIECSRVNSINKNHLKLYIQSLSHLKPKTIKRKIATVKAIFNFLEFEYDDFINPFRKMKIRIKEPFEIPTVMNLDDISSILKILYGYKDNKHLSEYKRKENIRDIAVIELLFASGIRVSELSNLSCKDVDLNNGVIKVFGKGKKERIIQICQQEVIESLYLYKSLFNPKGYFFINRLGNQLSTQSIRSMVKKYVCISKIEKEVTPHTFRHTFATLLLEEGVDIKYIQNLLGHSSISTTQIYTHINTNKQKEILSTKHPRRKLKYN